MEEKTVLTEEQSEEVKDIKQEETKEEAPKKEKKKLFKNNDEELLKLTELLGQEKEKSLRIQAEMMNFKRRKEDEVSSIRKYANEDILKKLVAIVDNFERALSMETEENKEFLEGFKMIYGSILNIFAENELVEIKAMDEEFDPNVHQAVLTEHVDGVEPGKIIEVLQKGYMYKDRVLRATMVKVSE